MSSPETTQSVTPPGIMSDPYVPPSPPPSPGFGTPTQYLQQPGAPSMLPTTINEILAAQDEINMLRRWGVPRFGPNPYLLPKGHRHT